MSNTYAVDGIAVNSGVTYVDNDQFLSDGKPKCFLVVVEVAANTISQTTTTLYFSTEYYTSTVLGSAVTFQDVVLSLPTISQQSSEVFSGKSSISFGTLSLVGRYPNGQTVFDETQNFYHAPIKILVGDTSWPFDDFIKVFEGAIESVQWQNYQTVELTLVDKQTLFNEGLQEYVYTTGNSDSTYIPLVFGKVFNIEPKLVDSATLKYQVGSGPIQAITDVRDDGATTAYTPNLTDGTFTLSANPYNKITCDVTGYYDSSLPLADMNKLGSIVYMMIKQKLTLEEINILSLQAVNALFPYDCGVYFKERINVLDALDEVLAPMDFIYGFDTFGKFYVKPLFDFTNTSGTKLHFPTSTVVVNYGFVDKDSYKRARIVPSNKLYTDGASYFSVVNYKKNYTVQEQLVGVVSAANKDLYGKEFSSQKTDVTSDPNAQESVRKYAFTLSKEPPTIPAYDSTGAVARGITFAKSRNFAMAVTEFTVLNLQYLNVTLGDTIGYPLVGNNYGQTYAWGCVVGIETDLLAQKISFKVLDYMQPLDTFASPF